MDLSLVILGIVLIFVLYYFLNQSGTSVLSNKLDLSTPQTAVPINKIPEPTSRKYSYEMWMYVFNFQGSSQYIVSRGSVADATKKNIGIKLDGSSPKLIMEYTATATGSTSAPKSVTITDNFPLQTWVHLIVSVDDKYVDIYMNGKLIKSIQDATIDTPSSTSTIEYGVTNCYLAKLSRTSMATDPQTAWDNYSAGNGENPMAKYLSSFGLSMTLQKNNQDYSKITLF
jgi:hypothetical protein